MLRNRSNVRAERKRISWESVMLVIVSGDVAFLGGPRAISTNDQAFLQAVALLPGAAPAGWCFISVVSLH